MTAAVPVRLRTDDGVEVDGDLVVAADAPAGAVVCHPHPAYGGDRHNTVVDRIFHTLAGAGLTVLRFDFRPGGAEDGADRDVAAAVDAVAGGLPPGRPLWLVGYSFGADVALGADDERVAGWVAVAPPLRFGSPPRAGSGDRRPVLIVAARHDDFAPPDALQRATADWADVTLSVIEGADHFLAGATGTVADAVLDWIRARR